MGHTFHYTLYIGRRITLEEQNTNNPWQSTNQCDQLGKMEFTSHYFSSMAQTQNRFSVLQTLDTEEETETPNLPPYKSNTILRQISPITPQQTLLDTPSLPTTKTYFKMIQVRHHTQIMQKALDTRIFPKGMTKQVSKFTGFIKSACPN